MHGKALSYREANKILLDNGFSMIRQRGDHCIYKSKNRTISITCGKTFSQKTWERECKKNNIIYK